MGLNSPSVRRIGVFGGTFDPIHNGHLSVARFALEHGNLDMVLLVPAGRPWLREGTPTASAEHRLRMVELAVTGEPGLAVSDIDVTREGDTFTVDTLADLRAIYGDSVELVLIVGVDSALQMDRWDRASKLRSLCTVVVVGRPGEEWSSDLSEAHPAFGAEYFEGPMLDISATRLRNALGGGEDVERFLPVPVLKYIEKHRLYRD